MSSRPVHRILLAVIAATTAVAGATFASFASAQTAQDKARAHLEQLNKMAGPGEDVCKMFTRAEIAKAAGFAVKNGEVWGLGGSGCQWETADESQAVQVVLVRDTRYWENLARSSGGQALPGIGKQAFVAPWIGSQRAGALTDQVCVYVMSPNREVSVGLLKQAIERIPK